MKQIRKSISNVVLVTSLALTGVIGVASMSSTHARGTVWTQAGKAETTCILGSTSYDKSVTCKKKVRMFRKNAAFCNPIKAPFDAKYWDILAIVQTVLSKGNSFSGSMNKYGYYSHCYKTVLIKEWKE